MFGPSTQGSLNTDIKELEITNIRLDVNVMKDNYHDLLNRVIANENTIELLKKEKQNLTHELENLSRQLSCEIEVLHDISREHQQELNETHFQFNHTWYSFNQTVHELSYNVDVLDNKYLLLERKRSGESFKECINKTEVVSVCTFESTVEENCFFYNDESGLDKKNWRRNSGGTSTPNTGPSRAMAGNYYMYIESGSMAYLENALLVSNILQQDVKLCLSFYYHMYGKSIRTLEVIVSSSGTNKTIFARSGDQGNQWYYKKLYIQPASNLQIMFNGIGGHNSYGDIALDNIMLFAGECVIPANSENERKITLREVIDARKLEYIVSHPDDFHLGSRHINGQKIDKNGQLTLLKNCLEQVNEKGERLMNYYQINKFGRYWTEGDIGIQNMSRKIRHTLCQDFVYDIDMKNAHPTLLSWYCHDNGINCTGLDAYIANREEYMADWMMCTGNIRDEVKAHLLAIINRRKVNLEPEDPEWYKEFYNGMRYISDSIVKLRPDLYELAKKSKNRKGTDYNIEGTTVNYVMCSLENKSLMTAFDYLTEQGIEVGSLLFDGLMIYKDNVSSERLLEILAGCSQNVKEVMESNEPVTKGWYAKNWQDLVKNLTDRVNDLEKEIKGGRSRRELDAIAKEDKTLDSIKTTLENRLG
ncbi:unnamed protein product [Mytilus coruscus]|uniref:MAM domain-containing protein n=1 Tax=Mytilus coruscus TaxID=42192 RepID=A0A6J8BDQ7_MYTCO|nr:unnamed protein product [Mytilus coruscus]